MERNDISDWVLNGTCPVFQSIFPCIILYYIILYYIILYYIILYYIILYYVLLDYVLFYIILHYVILCYILSYFIIVYLFLYIIFLYCTVFISECLGVILARIPLGLCMLSFLYQNVLLHW